MPNIENLRKQAKLILRWHREGYHPVAAQIRSALPRFRDLDDARILAHRFRLGDAQEVVARQAGFDGWQALKAGIAAMTDQPPRTPSPPLLLAAEPQLFVTDMRAASAFYTGKLGFGVVFLYGDPPFYGQVRRDGARLNLRHVDAPVIDDTLRRRDDLLSASVTVASGEALKSLFLEFQAAAVPFHQPLRREPWGARTFIVRDPDGNLILFAGPAD